MIISFSEPYYNNKIHCRDFCNSLSVKCTFTAVKSKFTAVITSQIIVCYEGNAQTRGWLFGAIGGILTSLEISVEKKTISHRSPRFGRKGHVANVTTLAVKHPRHAPSLRCCIRYSKKNKVPTPADYCEQAPDNPPPPCSTLPWSPYLEEAGYSIPYGTPGEGIAFGSDCLLYHVSGAHLWDNIYLRGYDRNGNMIKDLLAPFDNKMERKYWQAPPNKLRCFSTLTACKSLLFATHLDMTRPRAHVEPLLFSSIVHLKAAYFENGFYVGNIVKSEGVSP